jgi:hypothetical protein
MRVVKKISVLIFTLFFSFLNSQNSKSAELDFGLTPTYSNNTFAGQSENSIYSGFGALSELRLRFPKFSGSPLALSFFGLYNFDVLQNINHSTQETLKERSYGGGIDFNLGVFFIGTQFEKVKALVSAPGTRKNVAFNQFGPRVGFSLPVSKSFILSFGGSFLLGQVDFINDIGKIDYRNIQNMRGFFMVSWRIAGDTFKSSSRF